MLIDGMLINPHTRNDDIEALLDSGSLRRMEHATGRWPDQGPDPLLVRDCFCCEESLATHADALGPDYVLLPYALGTNDYVCDVSEIQAFEAHDPDYIGPRRTCLRCARAGYPDHPKLQTKTHFSDGDGGTACGRPLGSREHTTNAEHLVDCEQCIANPPRWVLGSRARAWMEQARDHLLEVLLDLDEDVLLDVYNIEDGCDAPLDLAVFAFRKAVLDLSGERPG